jgi:hypothetical protein
MSSLARWTYKEDLTIWPFVSETELNVPTYGAPYIIKGSWKIGGGTQVAQTGEEFTANSTYYMEGEINDPLIPTRADYIAQGDLTGQAEPITAGAEKIKKIASSSMKAFGASEIPDWKIYT